MTKQNRPFRQRTWVVAGGAAAALALTPVAAFALGGLPSGVERDLPQSGVVVAAVPSAEPSAGVSSADTSTTVSAPSPQTAPTAQTPQSPTTAASPVTTVSPRTPASPNSPD